MIKFTKMHGTGNDYVIINTLKIKLKDINSLAKKMCNRNYGIGADGLLLIIKSDSADFKMQMINPDGTEAEMCGNGIRCFSKYIYDHKFTSKKTIEIETLSGIKTLNLNIKNNKVDSVIVDMGEPVLQKSRIPMLGEPGMAIDELLHLDDGAKFNITAVSMGNPHVVIFVEDINNFPIEKYGPIIENHDLFPNRTNVEFVQIINETEVSQRTWERGAGETLSCGTGASAVTAACILNKKTKRKTTVHLTGGDLKIEWKEDNNKIYMTGPAVEVFNGEWIE